MERVEIRINGTITVITGGGVGLDLFELLQLKTIFLSVLYKETQGDRASSVLEIEFCPNMGIAVLGFFANI